MSSSTTLSLFDSFQSDLGAILATGLGKVLVIAVALIGLGILLHYIRKWVGRR